MAETKKGHEILEELRKQNGRVDVRQLRCDYVSALCPKCKMVRLWVTPSLVDVRADDVYSKKRCSICFKTYNRI